MLGGVLGTNLGLLSKCGSLSLPLWQVDIHWLDVVCRLRFEAAYYLAVQHATSCYHFAMVLSLGFRFGCILVHCVVRCLVLCPVSC